MLLPGGWWRVTQLPKVLAELPSPYKRLRIALRHVRALTVEAVGGPGRALAAVGSAHRVHSPAVQDHAEPRRFVRLPPSPVCLAEIVSLCVCVSGAEIVCVSLCV
eukprot:3941043-Rhodomonas_salina.3